jgi:hypothetical protein
MGFKGRPLTTAASRRLLSMPRVRRAAAAVDSGRQYQVVQLADAADALAALGSMVAGIHHPLYWLSTKA